MTICGGELTAEQGLRWRLSVLPASIVEALAQRIGQDVAIVDGRIAATVDGDLSELVRRAAAAVEIARKERPEEPGKLTVPAMVIVLHVRRDGQLVEYDDSVYHRISVETLRRDCTRALRRV